MNVPLPNAPGSSRTALTRIVGLGASAGGLEALEQFLAHVPKASGLAVEARRGLPRELCAVDDQTNFGVDRIRTLSEIHRAHEDLLTVEDVKLRMQRVVPERESRERRRDT